MITPIIIPGRFSGLNDFIDANRRQRGNWSAGNAMKQKDQKTIRDYLPRTRIEKPVHITFLFYEPNARRDIDNVSGYFHKIFMDALVDVGIIENDGPKYVKGLTDYHKVDKKWPRIEVYIEEE